MKFDINNYKGNYAMHCVTEEEAREFCNYLHSVDRIWIDCDSYLGDTNYDVYESETSYAFNGGRFASVKFHKRKGYTVLEFSDFDWSKEFTKADLKTGDIVLHRDGSHPLLYAS